jgi:Na+-driven multidrug efflux pump
VIRKYAGAQVLVVGVGAPASALLSALGHDRTWAQVLVVAIVGVGLACYFLLRHRLLEAIDRSGEISQPQRDRYRHIVRRFGLVGALQILIEAPHGV